MDKYVIKGTASPGGASNHRKATLQATAQQMKQILPNILELRPDAPPTGLKRHPSEYTPLSSRYFPNLHTRVRVVEGDSYDVALTISNGTDPVCVLNMASERSPGGGWLSGALAQEEALCYRSSLSFTLKRRFYPIKDLEAIYSPTVLIIRDSFADGHKLKDLAKPELLPVVSVVSIAALRRPAVNSRSSPPRYVYIKDRDLMKDKMRVILRVAAHNRHRKLVLGAFGCGAFANPNNEVADCWIEILEEQEFRGWWEDITFAVLKDRSNNIDNFTMFHTKLNGLEV